MIKAFERGLDIHKVTASRVFGIPLEKVGPAERRLAKTLNFGLIYGMGAPSFARTSGLTTEKAREFITAYFKAFSQIKVWQEKIKSEVRTSGFARTPTGRRRYLFGAATDSPRLVSEAERAAINFPIQGFGADIIKMSMIRSRKVLEEAGIWGAGARLILSIHDELLFEVRDDKIRETAELIGGTMEKIYTLKVPLVVNVSCGKDWGNMEKL